MVCIVAAFNKEKALVGAFSVIVQLCRLIVYSTSHHADRVGHVVADEVRVLEGLHAEAAVVAARVRQRAHRARSVQAQAAGPRHLAPEADVDPGPGKLEIIFRCFKKIFCTAAGSPCHDVRGCPRPRGRPGHLERRHGLPAGLVQAHQRVGHELDDGRAAGHPQ